MSWAYEYIVGLVWGEEVEEEPIPDEEEDSMEGSISETMDALTTKSQFVIRKSTTAGFQPAQSFRAIPSMVIKAPEPQDNYDSSVIAIMLTPAGGIISVFGSIITLLAYTTIVGFKSEESVAYTHYGFPVKLIGPGLIVVGSVLLLLAAIVMMCTPRQRDVPMLYPQLDDEEASHVRVASSRRVSIAPTGSKVAQSPSGGMVAQSLLSSGSKLAVLPTSATVV